MTCQFTPKLRPSPHPSNINDTPSDPIPLNSSEDEVDDKTASSNIHAPRDADETCTPDTRPIISPLVSSGDEDTSTSASATFIILIIATAIWDPIHCG